MLTKSHLDTNNIIELLGLESLPVDAQQQVVDSAAEVVDLRCLERVLDSLSEQEKTSFTAMLEKKDQRGMQALFKKNNIDILHIIDEEIRQFKQETLQEVGVG